MGYLILQTTQPHTMPFPYCPPLLSCTPSIAQKSVTFVSHFLPGFYRTHQHSSPPDLTFFPTSQSTWAPFLWWILLPADSGEFSRENCAFRCNSLRRLLINLHKSFYQWLSCLMECNSSSEHLTVGDITQSQHMWASRGWSNTVMAYWTRLFLLKGWFRQLRLSALSNYTEMNLTAYKLPVQS